MSYPSENYPFPSKKQTKPKRHLRFALEEEMTFFNPALSSKFLTALPTSRTRSQKSLHPPDDIDDDFLSSDLEVSFASNVSLNSPPRDAIDLSMEYEPMDISPAPPQPKNSSRDRSAPSNGKLSTRPRAFTTAARMFGRDVSNDVTSSFPLAPSQAQKSEAKRTQRGALPSEWLMVSQPSQATNNESLFETVPSPISEDAMDVDSDEPGSSCLPAPSSAAPSNPEGFDTLFYDTMSPRKSFDSPSAYQSKKRRSLSPDTTRRLDSSPSPPPSSPTLSKLERISSGNTLARLSSKPLLQDLGDSSSNLPKRPRKLVLSALVQPSGASPIHSASAYPILNNRRSSDKDDEKCLPPARRAVSALMPPKGFGNIEPYSEESSFEGPDMSSPAQAYAKRQQSKTIRRCDGTDDFKPILGLKVGIDMDSPSRKFMAAGLPGFGDNEAHGKILPCHRVKEDGLMRINSKTLNDLIDGQFSFQVAKFHIIDCRFDYEYNGGHVPGAVNIKNPVAVEEFLLSPDVVKPPPSLSGDSNKKTVLVFHCEFSSKRAPTFAKHLRAKDRALNNHAYPKIHYPEVYILEGGYCQYYKHSATRCQPLGYVRMNDPNYVVSRKEDMDQFRKNKLGRYKSYAYGEGPFKATAGLQQQQPHQSKRNTAPSVSANTLFAAANAARTRRGGGLSMLEEDVNSGGLSDDDADIGDSPCPPPTKTASAFKGKKIGSVPLMRAETYGPARFAY